MGNEYHNIKSYISKICDKTSQINPIYIRNFRELIKLIPLLGSWIDAHTVGTITDNILEERLRSLEQACRNTLDEQNQTVLVDRVSEVNSLIFGLIAAYQEQIYLSNQEILRELRSFLTIPKGSFKLTAPHSKFRFIVISGASATGKDIILDLLLKHGLCDYRRTEVLTKYSTRKPRLMEHSYSENKTDEEFQELLDADKVLFPYYKRGNRYGFDKRHFYNASRSEVLLFAIFTEFEMLPEAKQYLKEQGIRSTTILLEADEEDLIHRSTNRFLPLDEINSRNHSIIRDLKFISNNRNMIEEMYDYIINNGDMKAKMDTYEQIVSILEEL